MEHVEDCPDNNAYDSESDSDTPKKKRKCRTVNPSSQRTFGSCFGLASLFQDFAENEVRADVYMTFAMFTAVLAIIRLMPKY